MEIETQETEDETQEPEDETRPEVQVDEDDYKGASLDDTYKDLQHPQVVEWPNDAYRKFMEITTKFQLSNSAGVAMI